MSADDSAAGFDAVCCESEFCEPELGLACKSDTADVSFCLMYALTENGPYISRSFSKNVISSSSSVSLFWLIIIFNRSVYWLRNNLLVHLANPLEVEFNQTLILLTKARIVGILQP